METISTLIFIVLMVIIFRKPVCKIFNSIKKDSKRRMQEYKLSEDKYRELKNKFDARRVMDELNYIIVSIKKFYDEKEYLEEYKYHRIADNTSIYTKYIRLLFFPFANKPRPEEVSRMTERTELFKSVRQELNTCIKTEWDPRIKILTDHSLSYRSDEKLRDDFKQLINRDAEIQKLTIEAERTREIVDSLKVVGGGLVVVTGLALGAASAAKGFGDRQMIRDNLSL